MSNDLKEKAVALAYPPKADAKGSARVNWRRKPFYFGPHDTPESFQLFVEWKRRLIASDGEEPVEVKAIRRDLAHQQYEGPDTASESKQNGFFALVAIAACVSIIVGTASVFLVSGTNPFMRATPVVDGVALSEGELQFVRGMRDHQKAFSSSLQASHDELAELTVRLNKQGPRNGAIHQIKMDDGT